MSTSGKVLQEQRAVLDHFLQVEFDVVAVVGSQGHLVGEHRDLVATLRLGLEHRLIGPAKQI